MIRLIKKQLLWIYSTRTCPDEKWRILSAFSDAIVNFYHFHAIYRMVSPWDFLYEVIYYSKYEYGLYIPILKFGRFRSIFRFLTDFPRFSCVHMMLRVKFNSVSIYIYTNVCFIQHSLDLISIINCYWLTATLISIVHQLKYIFDL